MRRQRLCQREREGEASSVLTLFDSDKPPDVGPLPRVPPPPSARRTHPGPTRTYETNPAFCCSQKKRTSGESDMCVA